MKEKTKMKDFLKKMMIIFKSNKNMLWLYIAITNVLNVKNLILVELKIVKELW